MYPCTHQYVYTYMHQVLDVESVAEEDQRMNSDDEMRRTPR